MAGENTNNVNGQVANGTPEGTPEATKPEKEGFFARKKREHDERREARRNMTHGEWCDTMKKKFLIGGACAGITAIAVGIAYSKGQSDGLTVGETMALPDNTGDDAMAFDNAGEDVAAFEPEDATFENEPME